VRGVGGGGAVEAAGVEAGLGLYGLREGGCVGLCEVSRIGREGGDEGEKEGGGEEVEEAGCGHVGRVVVCFLSSETFCQCSVVALLNLLR